jgi:hypothetical protein
MLRQPIPASVRAQVLNRDRHTCYYCGARGSNVRFHMDHVVPVSWGGTNDLANLVTACSRCNLKKGATVTGAWESKKDELPMNRRGRGPKDIERLRKREVELARKRQDIREQELIHQEKRKPVKPDKKLEKREKKLAIKQLDLAEKQIDFQRWQVEQARKKGGCCIFMFLAIIALPTFFVALGVSTL